MISNYRKAYNQNFSEEKYNSFLDDIAKRFAHKPKFKIAETPVFIPKGLKRKLKQACKEIMQVIDKDNFKSLTDAAFFNDEMIVPNENDKPKFIQLDFGVCEDDNGDIVPKLIELQGFPSLYCFQEFLGGMYRKHFGEAIPDHLSQHITGITPEEYLEKLRREIVGNTDPKQVVLLEIEPENQATAIDFYATEAALGIKVLCITKLIKRGKELFYKNEEGNLVKVLRIYNRIIFDELYQFKHLKTEFKFTDEVDVKWIGHPNWFFRVSKFTMPLLKGEFVPKSFYLDKLENIPEDLDNYVLKPLYSFAGAGVQIHVTKEMIDAIENKSNFLLQEKVTYAPVIDTMDVPAKCEIRMMMMHNSATDKFEIVSNLIRLSKGEMVGVKYNRDKTWVGGSTGFFVD